MTPPMDFKDLPAFAPNKPKLLAAILLLMEEAAKVGRELTSGEIAKSLFIADDQHLAAYNRPVTFDNYVAMKNGPVGDLAIDMLNDRPQISWSEFGVDRVPWSSRIDADRRCFSADVASDRRKLSRSDISALAAALEHVMANGFGSISFETHRHPAWKAAWNGKDENDRAAPMDWRHFPHVDDAFASDLAMASWNAA